MKAIILSRVSTQQQTLEQQTNVCIKKCNSLGYVGDDIIIIEDKESAIKLAASERQGITKMKWHIEQGYVNAVVVWELSRLSRKAAELYTLRDYFITHHVKFYICEPDLQIIDENGKVNQLAGVLYAMFSAFAESEMDLKKERMSRGKKQKQSDGKYIGGHVAVGYKVENDHVVIDEEKAKIVRMIFNLYEQGYSIYGIREELAAQGMITKSAEENDRARIRIILNNEGYTGQNSKSYPYPSIISKEQYDRCRQISLDRKKPHWKTQMTYYLNGLLINRANNRALTPCIANRVYSSYKYGTRESISINMDYIESFVLFILDEHLQAINTNDEMKQQMRLEMVSMHRKRIAAKKQISQLYEKLDRIEERYIDGHITKEKADKKQVETMNEINRLNEDIMRWDYEIPIINEQIKHNTYRTIYELDDEQKRIIIHKFIHKIYVERTTKQGEYLAEVLMDNSSYHWTLICKNKKCKCAIKDGQRIDFKIINRTTLCSKT